MNNTFEQNNLKIPVWTLTLHDLQLEAQERLGRSLDENEIERAKKIIEFGLGETFSPIYDAVFDIIESKAK